MKIRALIVDDEPLAREGIRAFLAEEADVEIIAECADGAAAIRAAEESHPDLIFLDVQMPRLNGFEVIEALAPEKMPLIIFTTAHDAHAIRAFEVNALDYLLKPFKQARFRTALQRAREQLAAGAGGDASERLAALLAGLRLPASSPPRILIKSPGQIMFLKPEDVDYIEASGNYLLLHTGTARHMIRETMAAMEERLAPAGFMRLSRSVIANLNRIERLQPEVAPGEYCVVLKGGARLNMTCSLAELRRRMDIA